MNRDVPRGDQGDEEPFEEPPDCPVCEREGNRGQPLVRRLGRWWCRHRGFVSDDEVRR